MTRGRALGVLTLVAMLAVVLTPLPACVGPTRPVVQPATESATQLGSRQRTPAHAAGLFVAESRTLGPIVIDGQGFVLYRYDADGANPPRSACVDACVADWLPVPATDDLRVVGIDRQLVARVKRNDGSEQLTLAGWPLYGYAGDRTPGETNGQRRGGQWFVIAPNGGRAGQPVVPAG